jgi:hypothetical protein
MQTILSRSGYFAADGLLRTVKMGLWGRPPPSLHFAASLHSSRGTTIRLFYIAHRGQSDDDSGGIVGNPEVLPITEKAPPGRSSRDEMRDVERL